MIFRATTAGVGDVRGTARAMFGGAACVRPLLGSRWVFGSDSRAPRLYAGWRDAGNRLRYGQGAPLFAERLWVDPSCVHDYDQRGSFRASGRVERGDWPQEGLKEIEDDPVLQTSFARWGDGLAWEETGELERMERAIRLNGPVQGCATRDDVLARCRRLDEIFRTIESEGRVRTRAEVEVAAFREFGGIGMHIGPSGTPIRAVNGRHRFAMARILALPTIPVRIGLVHHSALPLLRQYRRPGGATGG